MPREGTKVIYSFSFYFIHVSGGSQVVRLGHGDPELPMASSVGPVFWRCLPS